MEFALDTTAGVVNAASGLLLVLFAAGVLLLKPRTPLSLALAAYAGGLGFRFLVRNALRAEPWTPDWATWRLIMTGGALLAAAGVLALLHFLPGEGRRLDLLALAAIVPALLAVPSGIGPVPGGSPGAFVVAAHYLFNLAVDASEVAVLAALVLLPLRAARSDAATRRQLALVATALALYPAAYGPRVVVAFLRDLTPSLEGHAVLFPLVLAAILWLRAARPGQVTAALVAALLPLATALVASVAYVAFGLPDTNRDPGNGIARTVGVALLAFAVLRTQLLGFDVQIRWTVRNSTLGAIFVAVFFVASEGAQILFGSENEWVGLAAAGALVFALAPLQRLAERVATAAVDLDGGRGATPDERVETYRWALRRLAADGALDRDDERRLARLATQLGLTPEQVLDAREPLRPEPPAVP